jgi:hypothetical protein
VVIPNQMAAVTVRVMASSTSGRRSPCSSCAVMPYWRARSYQSSQSCSAGEMPLPAVNASKSACCRASGSIAGRPAAGDGCLNAALAGGRRVPQSYAGLQ